jgi:hypothetical protein
MECCKEENSCLLQWREFARCECMHTNWPAVLCLPAQAFPKEQDLNTGRLLHSQD